MRNWLSSVVLAAAGTASAFAQQGDAEPYAELRAPAMAAYEAGETARAYTLFEDVFAQIPRSDPAERAATAFSLGILAHQSGEHARALEWLERGFELHGEAGNPPESFAQYIAYAGTVSAEGGELEQAITYFRRALEQGPDGDDMREWRASTLTQLANALHAAGRYHEASERRRNALATYMEAYGPDHAYVGIVLEGLAQDVEADGHIGQAIDARRDALRIALSTREPDDLTILPLAGQLADSFITDGNPEGLRDIAEMVLELSGENRHSARILSEIASRARNAQHLEMSADLHERAYALAEADPETPPEFLATYMLNRAIGVQNAQGYAAALPLLEEYFALVRRADGEPGLQTAAASERVWTALFRLGRFRQAEANARERLEALTARADYPRGPIGRAYENLALSLHEQYRPDEAGPVFVRALEVVEHDPDAEGTLASLLDAYAIHLTFNNERERALEIAARNVDVRARRGGEDSPLYARGLHTLATVQRRLGMTGASLASLEAAQSLYEAAGPSQASGVRATLFQRAELLHDNGEIEAASTLLASAATLIPPDSAAELRDWHNLSGRVRRSQGRLSEALGHFREALAIREAREGAQARSTVFPLLNIAVTLRMQGQAAEAEPVVRRVLDTHAAHGVTAGHDVGSAWLELATVLEMQGRDDEARQAASTGHAMLAEVWPRGTYRRAVTDYNRAFLAMLQQDYATAGPMMRDAINDMRIAPDRSDVRLGIMLNSWGYLNERLGQYEDAATAYHEGLELRAGQLTNDHPALASARAFLARVLTDHLGRHPEGLGLFRTASAGLVEGIELRAGTAADDGVDGIEFARKDAFFTAHLEALWVNAHPDR